KKLIPRDWEDSESIHQKDDFSLQGNQHCVSDPMCEIRLCDDKYKKIRTLSQWLPGKKLIGQAIGKYYILET
ncbi:MAG: hypothetical protein R6V49_00635, partial [Bacteroidales bacterium]